MLGLLLAGAACPAVTHGAPLIVGTKESPPFSFRDKQGHWTGISIDLWKEIANQLDLSYEFREVDLDQMFDQLESGELDAAIAAISVTPERERRVEFSHPYYHSGIGIAVPVRGQRRMWTMLGRIFTTRFFQAAGLALVFMLLAGTMIWFFERKKNDIFRGKPGQGINEGLWWSTIMVLGHKGVIPRSLAARLIALSVMLVSFISVSVLTGAVASVMTLSQLSSPVGHPEDLRRLRTVTIGGSTSADFLEQRRIGFLSHENLEDAMRALTSGRADAVVYDAPMLRYLVSSQFPNSVQVLPVRFSSEEYAIALPPASERRKPINHALLLTRNQEKWKDLLYRYLGEY